VPSNRRSPKVQLEIARDGRRIDRQSGSPQRIDGPIADIDRVIGVSEGPLAIEIDGEPASRDAHRPTRLEALVRRDRAALGRHQRGTATFI
jgi:hypothetical protein